MKTNIHTNAKKDEYTNAPAAILLPDVNHNFSLISKLLFFVIITTLFALSASAQKGIYRRGYAGGPHMGMSMGVGSYGSSYLTPGYGLLLTISEIRFDYAQQIKSTRKDKSISRKERKQKIKELKHERIRSYIDAERDYYSQFRNCRRD